ncbi:hypothetical protein TIFTF001_018640 [Ficus carica]|uniref:Uncharacterized protein n=1 Tax=Ficus carica TaxID=3494 RepID=A0AA88A4S1_FICCA|nr:hypothetical protein TIFTF001_018640 [Ficus carica]
MGFEEEIGMRSRGERERGRGARENEWWNCGQRRLEAREKGRGARENGGEVARERTRENRGRGHDGGDGFRGRV